MVSLCFSKFHCCTAKIADFGLARVIGNAADAGGAGDAAVAGGALGSALSAGFQALTTAVGTPPPPAPLRRMLTQHVVTRCWL